MTTNGQPIAVRQSVTDDRGADASEFDRRTATILASFNTWAFKRGQPTEPDLLAQTVAARLSSNEPISFVLYWGKGPRAEIAAPDITCLDYLGAMGARILRAYAPGALFNLCLTDTHARLNGHGEASIEAYFGGIAREASVRGMHSERLSRLTADMEPLSLGQPHAETEMLEQLERCAARWYRGDGPVREGARAYLAMNRVESRAVAARYRRTIFITFNGSAYRDLFPANMPVFYMNSLRRGTAVKPWFMDEHGQPFSNADVRGDAGAA